MGLSPLPSGRSTHNDSATRGHVQQRFALLIWDLSTPHSPSAHPALTWALTPS